MSRVRMKGLWASALLIATLSAADAQDKPNVVIMLGDNVGYGESIGLNFAIKF